MILLCLLTLLTLLNKPLAWLQSVSILPTRLPPLDMAFSLLTFACFRITFVMLANFSEKQFRISCLSFHWKSLFKQWMGARTYAQTYLVSQRSDIALATKLGDPSMSLRRGYREAGYTRIRGPLWRSPFWPQLQTLSYIYVFSSSVSCTSLVYRLTFNIKTARFGFSDLSDGSLPFKAPKI